MKKFYRSDKFKQVRRQAADSEWIEPKSSTSNATTWQAGLAESLEQDMTPAEKKLWKGLKPLANFLPQTVINNFICDFADLNLKIVIELDGSIHNLSDVKTRDFTKTKTLQSLGYKVLRFSNSIIFSDLQFILSKIKQEVKNAKT